MNPIQSHFMMMKSIIMSPKTFFEGVLETEGYKKVIIFAVINMILAFIISIIFSTLLGGNDQAQGIGILLIGSLFLTPFALVMLFIWTSILHVIAKVLGGKGTYNGSFLVVGYSTALMPFSALPIIGMIIALYNFYIEIVGFRKMHQYSTGRAVATILLPVILLVVLIIAGIAVAGVAFLSILRSGNINPAELQNLDSVGSMEEAEQMIPQEVKDQIKMMEDTDNTYMYDDGTYPTGYEGYTDDSTIMENTTQ